MGASTIVYVLSVAASLYATYLLAYCLYDVPDSWEKREPKRIFLPRITYILLLAASFISILNICYIIVIVIISLIGASWGDFQIKSWLFEKPREDKKQEENDKTNKQE